MHRGLVPLLLFLAGVSVSIYWAQGAHSNDQDVPDRREDQARAAKPVTSPQLLPGVLASGAIQLPNQWSLRPAGKQVILGDFPVNIAVHPEGRWLAILHAGYGTHEIVIVDVGQSRNKITCRV